MDPIESKSSARAPTEREQDASGAQSVERAPRVQPADAVLLREPDALLSQLRRDTIVDGKYRIDRRLGRGSMGIVVAATHLQLDERVALKFLHARIKATSADFHARFQREAQMSAKLRGEHVARVIDIGLWQDRYPFMVMDHLTGVDLRSTLKAWGGALSVDLATEYVVQICEGMAEAHALGIVHCDLKPSNMFVTKRPDGSDLVKILDFGVSQWSRQEDPSDDITHTGAVLGSPKYMAPERLFGSSIVDARADVWSIGAIYYELLVGRPAFDFATLKELYDAHCADYAPPSMRAQNPWVTPALEAVVMRCFARDRERRVPNVAELAGSILDAIGEPYAHDVQTRLAAVLDASGTRDLLASTSSTAPARISSPGIRSAHAEAHAGARRHSSSIPPPLPSVPPPLPTARAGLLRAAVGARMATLRSRARELASMRLGNRQRVAIAALMLLAGGVLAWRFPRASRPVHAPVGAAVAPPVVAHEPVRPAGTLGASPPGNASTTRTTARPSAPSVAAPARGLSRLARPLARPVGAQASEGPRAAANTRRELTRDTAQLPDGRVWRPATESAQRLSSTPPAAQLRTSGAPGAAPAGHEQQRVFPSAVPAGPEPQRIFPSAAPASEAPPEASSPPRSPLEDRQ